MNTTEDLKDEVQTRKESMEWEGMQLRNCPCCGSRPRVVVGHETIICCGRWGCRDVAAKTTADAIELWNAPRFTDHRP